MIRRLIAMSGAVLWTCSALLAGEGMTAEQIVSLHLSKLRTDSEMAFVRMQHKPADAPEREYRFLVAYQSYETGRSYFLRLVRPAEVQGVTVLAMEKDRQTVDHYFLLPTVGKMKQLVGDARHAAFLSSDYTFEDLLEEMPSWNSYERLADEEVEGLMCYRVRAAESGKAGASAYQHRDLFIDQEHLLLRKVDFYGRNGRLIKTLTATDYDSPRLRGQTTRPGQAVMTNHQTGSTTRFYVVEGRMNQKFDAELFTPERLERWTSEEVEEFIFELGLKVTAE